MSNLVTFSGANLPSVKSLSTSLRKLTPNGAAAGVAIIKMDRTGHWVFGADQTEIEDGSKWAINPFSFVHGFIAWGDGVVLGEKITSVSDPLPELDVAPPAAIKGWEPQCGMSLKCISGEDTGMEARFTTTSLGGRKAVQELAVVIAAQVDTDESNPVPIVTLGSQHYSHKSYGRIYTPVFEVKSWGSMDGAAPVAEAVEEAAPARRRRASV